VSQKGGEPSAAADLFQLKTAKENALMKNHHLQLQQVCKVCVHEWAYECMCMYIYA